MNRSQFKTAPVFILTVENDLKLWYNKISDKHFKNYTEHNTKEVS